MNLSQSFVLAHRRVSSSLWHVAIALLFVSPQLVVGSAPSGSLLVVLGKLESTSIKYQGIGKATGAQYKGTASVKVLEVLKGEGPQKVLTPKAKPEHVVLMVEEQHKKPGWEKKKGQSFIFVLEAIAGSEQFRVLDVGIPNDSTLRAIRESGQLGADELRNILHPSSTE
jgi:hypothetical protein